MEAFQEQQVILWEKQFGIRPDVVILGEPYLFPETVADQIHVKIGTLATWRSLNRGPKSAKFGHNIYYPLTELKRWTDDRIMKNSHEKVG